jgi:hypothetical protein
MQAYKTAQGNWQINFSEYGKQRTLYLGRDFTSSSADRICKIVSEILGCRKRGDVVPLEVVRRIELLPERVQKSFERLGLVAGTGSWTLAKLLESFYESKSHLKASSQTADRQVGKLLIGFFGGERRLSSITKLECERFRNQYLSCHSECTRSRELRRCRTIFRFAVEGGALSVNPFDKVPIRVDVNLSRQVYVDRSMITKVMEHCRDDHDRLILALARFGGLRIPSEIRQLRFCDFTENVIRIHKETKTGAREVPLFGEIREIFGRLVASTGGVVTCDSCPALSSGKIFSHLGDFRTRIVTAIRASGVVQWTKLFINLRSSCITDMVERRYSEKMLDSMFGNSSAIRQLHYVQFRKDKEYLKARLDNERILKMFREGAAEDEVDELLVLRDLLVGRFGIGKSAG